MKQIILTGDRPTGRLHVGHYVGSLKERVRLQNANIYDQIYIMIADAQALTDNAEHPEKVRQNILQVALDYLACGIDPEKSTIFIQSMIPELTELTFYYMNLVTVARVQRNPTVKAEIKQRNFEASIPVGFSAIRSAKLPISLHLAPLLCRPARIRSRCWNSAVKLSASSMKFTERHWLNRILSCLPIRHVCVCRASTAKQK